ncbi:glycosyltransferase family 2 protein [bacterium C-53]|nr:glycosyltransferase family 2 protein [Lachnospiraceae bacterium]NBI02894.1 glycosyltransferase family 2 protein [Lachnospiraceae bacterium]RKJ11018.1 glycosyltransferase family 2 protein [bacterium C-53]
MDKLYIVIPAYNERDTIKEIIEQWYPIVVKTGTESRLLIVNDGSRDDTYEIMKECAKSRPQFLPLTKKNGGHGATLFFAYHYALEHGADYIFQTDSDGQTMPEEFWPFWEMRDRYDMVIGHRSSRQDGKSRVFVTKVLKLTLKVCFGVTVTDANTPFRLMKAGTLKEYIGLIPKDFNLSNVIISVIYAKKGLKVKYMPITFRPRQGGTNSINLKKIFFIGVQALKDFREINKTLKGV